MPINISYNLPAFRTLQSENVFVMSDTQALRQDIRPLKVAIVNLMPIKIETETQLLRLLSNTPLQVDITLIRTSTHTSRNTSEEHLSNFYTVFDDIKDEYYDALLITGAPVEILPFEEVTYWRELCRIMEWSKSHVFNTMHICWGAQAGLYYHYGIKKYPLEKKMFGVFPHKTHTINNPIFKGFDDVFYVPHSRHTETREEDIKNHPDLILLSTSDMSGVYMVSDKTGRQIFITGHSEYEAETLKTEYLRDVEKGIKIDIPHNYFPENNPKNNPVYTWRGHASLMYSNWLNFCVYQETPYDLTKIKSL